MQNPLDIIVKTWKSPDLRTKIFYTIFILIIVRVLAHIPVPGVNHENLKAFFDNNQIFGFLDIFSGGTMSNFSLILLGVGPYITASIVMQLLVMIVPQLEALSKEGEYGTKKITQYTRYMTVPLGLVESYGLILLLSRGADGQAPLFANAFLGWDLAIALVTVTAGTILLMWLGELISESGIGNGISLIITIGIIGGIPQLVSNLLGVATASGGLNFAQILQYGGFGAVILFMIAFIVLVTEGQRNIPVSYASKLRGLQNYRRGDTYLPLKVNAAGMIPIIFAVSMMLFPTTMARFFQNAKTEWLVTAANYTVDLFANSWFYGAAFFVMVVLFTYFYTFIVFKPEQVAENLQKQGGFISGIRPGKETQEYLYKVVSRITLFGSMFLGFIAVAPFVIPVVIQNPNLVISGAGLLIVVGVVLDTRRQFNAHMLSRSYDME